MESHPTGPKEINSVGAMSSWDKLILSNKDLEEEGMSGRELQEATQKAPILTHKNKERRSRMIYFLPISYKRKKSNLSPETANMALIAGPGVVRAQ